MRPPSLSAQKHCEKLDKYSDYFINGTGVKLISNRSTPAFPLPAAVLTIVKMLWRCRLSPRGFPSTRRAYVEMRNMFPFPKQANPTPHQIFHLPRNASLDDIKSRYFELVRIYHPDSSISQPAGVSPEATRVRFHSITSAYATLLGKNSGHQDEQAAARNEAQVRATARWKATKARRYEYLDGGGLDERWKEWIFMGAVVLTAIAFVAQVAWTRRRAIAEAATIDGRRRPSGTKAPDEWSEPDLGASGGSASNVS